MKKSCVRHKREKSGPEGFCEACTIYCRGSSSWPFPDIPAKKEKGSRLPCCVIDWSSHTSYLRGGEGTRSHLMPFRDSDKKLGGLGRYHAGANGLLCCNKAQRKEAGCLAQFRVTQKKNTNEAICHHDFFFRHEIKIKLRHNLQALLQAPLPSAAFVSMLARFKLPHRHRCAAGKPDGMTANASSTRACATASSPHDDKTWPHWKLWTGHQPQRLPGAVQMPAPFPCVPVRLVSTYE